MLFAVSIQLIHLPEYILKIFLFVLTLVTLSSFAFLIVHRTTTNDL